MILEDALKRVAIIGAAGKMGRGISALLLQEIASLEASKIGFVGSGDYSLILIDSNEKLFISLKQYLHEQILKYAEKNIVQLRQYYAKNKQLVSNEEIIQAFVDGALSLFFIEKDLDAVNNSNLIFEAILENVDSKVQTLSKLKKTNPKALFLTNTSSIPIAVLEEKAVLNHQIIGYHFYNPPLIQRLLEVVIPEKIPENLAKLSFDLAKKLQKQVVISRDIAGFIGNGHFIRELIFASQLAKELGTVHGYAEGIYIINRITQDYLLRAMGIFQLADYVGVDVCEAIMKIMREYLQDDSLHDELIEWIIASGNRGGQDLEGYQKSGFFQYKGAVPKSVYSPESKTYLALDEIKIDQFLAFQPNLNWKTLQKDPEKQQKISAYMERLLSSPDLGCELARKFLHHSKAISERLVSEGVADKIEDVNSVLHNGFYHLYGADDV